MAVGQDENGQQDNSSFGELKVRGQATGQAVLHTLQEARPDPQIGQPIRPQGQRDTRREPGGGVKESQSAGRTDGQTQTLPSPILTRTTATKRWNPETAAMEEQDGQKDVGPDSEEKGGWCNPITEEDYDVWKDSDETNVSCRVEDDEEFEARTPEGNPLSHTAWQVQAGQRNFLQPLMNVFQQKSTKATSKGGTPRTPSAPSSSLEAQGNKSSTIVGPESETDQGVTEVTGSRCRLKAASYVRAARSRTRGETEKELNPKANSDSVMEKQKTVEQSPQIKVTTVDRSLPSQDNSMGLGRESGECLRSGIALERCELLPRPSLLGRRDGEVSREIACLKRERELVCHTAVVLLPPLAHSLPERDAPQASQVKELDASCDSYGMKEAVELREKPRQKGPPPPVPKKPKNPFVKLKTAQLMSADVQRRGKDNLQCEERVKRRHTFHFNKDAPWLTTRNQDMCLLWNERDTSVAPSGRRPLSVDLSPWEHNSLECMDDQYGDMIDFDYCARVGKLSPDIDLQDLDMMQRRIFFERRSRLRSSSQQPLRRKPPNPIASTETLRIPESRPVVRSERLSPKEEFHISPCENRQNAAESRANKNEESGGEIGSYKPVADIVKEKNQLQRTQGFAKSDTDRAQHRVTEQSLSVRVSQMKNAFDVPKKPRERQAEVQSSPKKGKTRKRQSSRTVVRKMFQ